MAPSDATEPGFVTALRRQISRLENENEAIREERDRFRNEVKAFRNKVNSLESQAEDLEIQNGDLKRKLSRTEHLPPPLKATEFVGPSKGTTAVSPASTLDVIEVDEDLETEAVATRSQAKGAKLRPPPSMRSSTRSSTSQDIPISTRNKRTIDTVDDTERPVTKVKKPSGLGGRTPSSRVINIRRDGSSSPATHPPSSDITPAKAHGKRPTIRAPKFPAQPSGSTSVPPRFLAKRREGLKVEADSLILPSPYILKYLGGCVPLSISPHPPTTLLKRTFISQTLGGNSQTLRTSSNYRNRQILFPTLDNNPDAPIHPGNPGLMLCSRTDVVGRFTVFSRVQVRPNPMWEYMGEYKTYNIGLLPTSIFNAQTQEVKETWAKTIDTKTWDPYPVMRARIAERKGGTLTRDDIIEALEQGDEKLGLLRMECISYDHEFIGHLMRRLRTWSG